MISVYSWCITKTDVNKLQMLRTYLTVTVRKKHCHDSGWRIIYIIWQNNKFVESNISTDAQLAILCFTNKY